MQDRFERGDEGGVLLAPWRPNANLAGYLAYTLWRCQRCGTAELSTLESQPERCEVCGRSCFEVLDE
jgi:rubrerythrin